MATLATRHSPFSVAEPKALFSYRNRQAVLPYLYVAPAMALFFLLMVFPMAMVFRYSLLDRAILSPDPAFVGLQNFRQIFTDPVFRESIGHTLYFTIMSVIFHLLIGLCLCAHAQLEAGQSHCEKHSEGALHPSLAVHRRDHRDHLAAAFWIRTASSTALLISSNILDFKVEWFSSPRTAIHALTFVNIWAGYPLYMVTLLAGLQGIPDELYEAANIDGANERQKLWHVTLPQLMPIIISISLLDFIWTMQVFPLVWMTTGGGPIHATEMMSVYTYKLAFSRFQFSPAAASAVVIFILSMSMTYFYIKHQKATR